MHPIVPPVAAALQPPRTVAPATSNHPPLPHTAFAPERALRFGTKAKPEPSRLQRFLNTKAENALFSNRPQILKLALRAGANPNTKSNRFDGFNERSLLQVAYDHPWCTPSERLTLMQHLLEAGADPNIRHTRRDMSLLEAAMGIPTAPKAWNDPLPKPDLPVFQLLLHHGANPNQSSNTKPSHSLLQVAAQEGVTSCVELLLAYGAHFPEHPEFLPWSSGSVLDPEILPLLLAAGMSPNLHVGHSFLMEAAQRGNLKAVDLLLKAGANVNQRDVNGFTALHKAVLSEHPPIVQRLLQEKAILVDTFDWDHLRPLTSALKKGNLEITQLLLAHGANPSQIRTHENISPISIAAETNAFHHRKALVKLLLRNGASRMEKSEKGSIPLAIQLVGNVPALEALLEEGLDPETALPDGQTLLHLAITKQRSESVKLLLAYGADPNRLDNNGHFPLYKACQTGSLQSVTYLLKAGASLQMKTRLGTTPIHAALNSTNSGNLSLLMKHGAALQPYDFKENALLARAVERDYPQTIQHVLLLGVIPNLEEAFWQKLETSHERWRNLPSILSALQAAGYDSERVRKHQDILKLGHALKKGDPVAFWQQWQTQADQIPAIYLKELFWQVEYTHPVPLGRKLLPELLAILQPYAQKVNRNPSDLSFATAAITRLYNFLGAHINKLDPAAYNTWLQVGAMGMGFSRWKFDAMTLYKGQGPRQEKSLLEQSGLFQPVPPRTSDAVYHRGYLHRDEETGLTVELRRAYMVVSHPSLGTLVVRNSSHHFGRDLLEEPAYYSPHGLAGELLNPNNLDPPVTRFMSVLGTQLNASTEAQQTHHDKINGLFEQFNQVMESYVAWKCQVQNGILPPGMTTLMKLALSSAEHNGQASAFGKLKPTRLAWVHPYALPNILHALDLSDPQVQTEVRQLLNLLNTPPDRRPPMPKIPQLQAFLKKGLSQGLELILTE